MSGGQGLPSELPCPGWVPTVAQKTGLDRRPGALHWGFLGASVIFLAPEEPDTSLPVKRQMYSTDWLQAPGGRGCAVHLVHLNLTCGQTQRPVSTGTRARVGGSAHPFICSVGRRVGVSSRALQVTFVPFCFRLRISYTCQVLSIFPRKGKLSQGPCLVALGPIPAGIQRPLCPVSWGSGHFLPFTQGCGWCI